MFVINSEGKAIPLSYFAKWQPANAPTIGESSGIIGGLDHLVQPADRKIALGRQCGDRSRNDPAWCAFDGCAVAILPARQHRCSRTMNSQVILIIAAIATVYIVLGILYESYVHPLTILSTPALGGR